ncbi:MAG TPA: dihydrodipicolinate reductase C-terminal domain-containing protein [Pyrinomonadaceae bacterium]|jgi:4-hydroxy-tetrahydrodipicolinate reductase
MRIALFGHGAMGQLVEARAESEGHEIALVLTSSNGARVGACVGEPRAEELAARLRGLEVAIDFSVAGAVLANVEACALARVPLVVGTTGWREHEPVVRSLISQHDGALIYGANFSVGVNLFYRIVARAAELFSGFAAYEPFIEEAHHARKRDAPSGTALVLCDIVAASFARDIPVASTRAGHIPGTHRVGFDSAADQIMLTHMARSRAGFAEGALLAARWIQGRRGVYEFSEMMDELLKERLKSDDDES